MVHIDIKRNNQNHQSIKRDSHKGINMPELTKSDLELIIKNMRGFSGKETVDLCTKIQSKIDQIEEIESLAFDDCESCKL